MSASFDGNIVGGVNAALVSVRMADEKQGLLPHAPSSNSYGLQAGRVFGLLRRLWRHDCCPLVPARYALPVFGFLGFFFVYLLRANLSIAIVAMVDDDASGNSSSLVSGCREL